MFKKPAQKSTSKNPFRKRTPEPAPSLSSNIKKVAAETATQFIVTAALTVVVSTVTDTIGKARDRKVAKKFADEDIQ